MKRDHRFPDVCAGTFPEPPLSFTDAEGRTIEVREFDPTDEKSFESLVTMYVDFDPADRAQGIPPTTEEDIRTWLDVVVSGGQDVVAWDDDRIVGHATLVPDDDGGSELAIFVHQDYQRSGIGSRLLPALLGHGTAEGVERVWLTVERWNHAAVSLYESVGFETMTAETFELRMSIRLS